MLYRGSEHGWKRRDFHLRCDNKGETISLFKIKDGDTIGGYTKALWESPIDAKYVCDHEAMLFNLSSQSYFTSNRTGKQIFCN